VDVLALSFLNTAVTGTEASGMQGAAAGQGPTGTLDDSVGWEEEDLKQAVVENTGTGDQVEDEVKAKVGI
jgi:hypothetical protein